MSRGPAVQHERDQAALVPAPARASCIITPPVVMTIERTPTGPVDARAVRRLLRLRLVRRRMVRRLLISCIAGLAGIIGCAVRSALEPSQLGYALSCTGLLALAAFLMGLDAARDVRRVTAKINYLRGVLVMRQ